MLDPMIVPTFNPELYYTRQLRGNTHYPIYQSGRGLGSRLFSIVKSVGAPLLKDVILRAVKVDMKRKFLFSHMKVHEKQERTLLTVF